MSRLSFCILAALVSAVIGEGPRLTSREAVFQRRVLALKEKKAKIETESPCPPLDREVRVIMLPKKGAGKTSVVDDRSSDDEKLFDDAMEALDRGGDRHGAGVTEALVDSEGTMATTGVDDGVVQGPKDVQDRNNEEEEEDDEGLGEEAARALVMQVFEEKKRRAALRNRFSSKAEREAEALARTRVYATVLVAIRLPDGSRIEGRFHPKEDVSALYLFAKEYLSPDVLKMPGLRLMRDRDREAESQPGALPPLPTSAAPDGSQDDALCAQVQRLALQGRGRVILAAGTTLEEAGVVPPASVVHLGIDPVSMAARHAEQAGPVAAGEEPRSAGFPPGTCFLSEAAIALATGPPTSSPSKGKTLGASRL